MREVKTIPKPLSPAPLKTDLDALLAAVAGGDQEALALLYGQVESTVRAFAMSRVGDPEVAADILHEVMLIVWRTASSFSNRSKPLTWILGIAHHKICDALRRKGRWQTVPADDDAIDTSLNPFDRAAHGQRRSAVGEALDTLSDSHRQVVHLAFFEDLSYPEIARTLKIPEGTVKTRIFHAKKALGSRLRPLLTGAFS